MGRTITQEQKRAIPPGFLQELNCDLMEDLWFALAAAKHPEAFAEADPHPTLEEVFERHLADVSWEDFWKAFPYEFREQGTCLDEIDALGLLLSTAVSRSRFQRHFEHLATSSSSNSSRQARQPAPWPGIRLGSNSINRTNSSRALARAFSSAPVPPYFTASPALQPGSTMFDQLLARRPQTDGAAWQVPLLRRRFTSRPPMRLAPRPPSQQQNVAYVSPVSAHRGLSTIRPAARLMPASDLPQALRPGQQPQQQAQQQRTGLGPFSWWNVSDSAFLQAPAWPMGGVPPGSRPWELGMLPPAAPAVGGPGDVVDTRAGGMLPSAEATARSAAAAGGIRAGSAGAQLAGQAGSARAALQRRHAAAMVPEARATSHSDAGELSRRGAAAAEPGVPRGAAAAVAGQEASPGDQRNRQVWEEGMQPSELPQSMALMPWAAFPQLEDLPSPDGLLASTRQARGAVPGVYSPVSGSPYDSEEPGSDEGFYDEGDAAGQQLPDLYDMYESERAWAAAAAAPDVGPFAAAAAATAAMAAAAAAVAAAASGHRAAAAVPRRRLTGLRRSWQEACDPESFEQQQQGPQQPRQNAAQGAAAQPQQAEAAAAAGQAGVGSRANYRPVWRAVHDWLTGEDEDMLVLVMQIVPYSLAGRSLRSEEDTLQQLRALANSRPVPDKVITSIADRLYQPCLSGEAHLVRLTASSGFSRQAAAAAAVLDCCERHGVRPFYVSLAGLCSEDDVEAAVMRGLFHDCFEPEARPRALTPAPAAASLEPEAAADAEAEASAAGAAGGLTGAAPATAVSPGSLLTPADMDAMLSIMQAHAAGVGRAQAAAAYDSLDDAAPADGPTAAAAAAAALQAGPVGGSSTSPPRHPASARLLSRSRSPSTGLGATRRGDSSVAQGEGFDQSLAAHLTLLARAHSRSPMLLLLDEVDAAMALDDGRPLRELLLQLLCHLPQAVVLITSSSSLDAWRDAAVLRQVGDPLVQQLYDGRLVLVEHRLPHSPVHPHCYHLFQYL